MNKKLLLLTVTIFGLSSNAMAQIYPASPGIYGYNNFNTANTYNQNYGYNSGVNQNNNVGSSMTPWGWGSQNLQQGVTTPVGSSVIGNRMNQNQNQNNDNTDSNEQNPSDKKTDKDKDKKEDNKPQETIFQVGETIKGRASVINPLTLNINGNIVVLSDLESPYPNSMCNTTSGVQWACGKKTIETISDIVSNKILNCFSLSHSKIPYVTCQINGASLAEQLVKSGFYIGKDGKYQNALDIAKSDHRGIW
jgi:endonuclease YncB( thermonuclease family)